MPTANDSTATAKEQIIKGVIEQTRELQPNLAEHFVVNAIIEELLNLNSLIGGKPNDMVSDTLLKVLKAVEDIQIADDKQKKDFAPILRDLNTLKHLIANVATKEAMEASNILANVISQIFKLLNYRPDVTAVLGDLEAIKKLKGGPADATAFHDFHVLQVAFKHVWLHAFDEELSNSVEDLFKELIEVYADFGQPVPDFGTIDDVDKLNRLLSQLQKDMDSFVPFMPDQVRRIIGDDPAWGMLSDEQRASIIKLADDYFRYPHTGQYAYIWAKAEKDIRAIIQNPMGANSRITKLISEIGKALSEPYAFDVFAPNSYNYGIMLTYRQKWEPGEYQAGDLVATIPLAPGENRKYTKKQVIKKSRAEREIEKSMSTRSEQSSEISRAESEIMKKSSTATNFKMTSSGSFNIGIGSIGASSEFAMNQALESASNKKEFHEATMKAAEEYRLERSLEVDTSMSIETEETSSGEISNPNNEITVTYLFYELQRRYTISEQIHRARPVILVAQDVPAPHEITEAWLIQYQWIISRVLLDDSLRSALNYLTSGFAGDEVSINVLKAHWENQRELALSLESQANAQLAQRDALREYLVKSALDKSLAEVAQKRDTVGSVLANIFTAGLAFPATAANTASGSLNVSELNANRKAAETRLKYVEEAVTNAQDKLKQAADSFEKATQKYTSALQEQYNRHVTIDQLRVHVKQNILYYMQAIWDHEPPDQRFFRLYNKKVVCPKPDQNCYGTATVEKTTTGYEVVTTFDCAPVLSSDEVDLIEIADLDNPIGYKGNYIIFPLKKPCYLTDYMLQEYFDDYFGVNDPDLYGNAPTEQVIDDIKSKLKNNNLSQQEKEELKKHFLEYISTARKTTDEIIVPTGQLFIEALPGSHPLLEDFKLLHRFEDVRKVKAEVRHAELENLRLASRLVAGQTDTKLLEDPDIEKRVIVEGNGTVSVGNP